VRRLSGACLATFLWFLPVVANAEEPQTRERDAIGAIEILIKDADEQEVTTERATGTIVSPEGYVVTAAHIFDDTAYRVCTAAMDAPPGLTCQISFYPKGNLARRAALQIVSERSATQDFLVLRLPPASDVTDHDAWPFVFVGQGPTGGATLYAGGYDDTELRAGAANRLRLIIGVMSSATTAPCVEGEGWGISNVMSGQTQPGNSGGPVFDTQRRLVGIVLGRTCATGPQSAPGTRVLTLASIPNYCDRMRCQRGFPGDVARYVGSNPRDWRQRLERSPESGDEIFGWKLEKLSLVNNVALVCMDATNPAWVQELRAAHSQGSEIASVFLFIAAGCGMPIGVDVPELRRRTFELAESGYEPAQYIAAQTILAGLQGKLAAGASTSSYHFTETERADIDRAERFLRNASEAGWAAAAYLHFEMCRTKLITCTSTEDELENAARLGAFDARRFLALALLQGDSAETWNRRFNISLLQDTARGVDLLEGSAPGAVFSSRLPNPLADITSSQILTYLYSGGRIQGRQVVTPDLVRAQTYQTMCIGLQINGANPVHQDCALNFSIAQFNLGGQAQRDQARQMIGLIKNTPTPAGLAAGNIIAWLERFPQTREISCDLNDELEFSLPTNSTPLPRAGAAYCHFPPPG
jgi:hypothetical protein